MADIRFSTTVIDDFQRADEFPIEPPWVRNWSAGIDCDLQNGNIQSSDVNPAESAQSFWETENFDATENPVEIWAAATGTAAQADSFRIGLCDDAAGMNGYLLRCENPVGDNRWAIRKYSGGTATEIAFTEPATLPEGEDLVLMQIVGSSINCYLSEDAGANWTLVVSASDSSYRTNLFLHLGANGGEPAWGWVGGGLEEDFIPQIYRRPNE